MAKKNILTILLDLVFIVAFNLIFYINGGVNHAASVWIVYGFLHFAYLMTLLTPLFASKRADVTLPKTVTYSISLAYFLIQLIFAVALFFAAVDRTLLIATIEIVITAVYLIILLVNLLADDATEKKQIVRESEVSFIKDVSNQLKYIESLASDKNLQSKIESVYTLAHSSPSKSNSQVKSTESEILENLKSLEKSAQNDAENSLKTLTEIERLLNKRNFELRK